MDIRISGHQVDTGEALKAHVENRLQSISAKYFSRAISANVTFGKGPHDHGFSCDIVAHVMHGVVLKGSADAQDAHVAFDATADKIEKQLRRYMDRLKSRNGHVAEPVIDDGIVALDNAAYVVFANQEEEEPEDNPPIIAEMSVDIPDATVSDAVMMLDLRNTNALMFKNSGTGAFNMVYRRRDGTIGWVEPR